MMNRDSVIQSLAHLRAIPHSGDSRRGVQLAALRIPLAAKLVGANLIVIGILVAGWLAVGGVVTELSCVLLGVAVLVHLALVIVALRPIRDLEGVAARVWRGDFGARVDQSIVADHEVLRVGAMFNILLDGLAADRARSRALAAEVIAATDRERAALARELHDSTAQRLAGLLFQISVASRDCTDPVLAARLADARDWAEEVTEEVRLLSHTVHPRVLDDLGLVPALNKLARDSAAANAIDIDVDVASTYDAQRELPKGVPSALYRVAQEAVRNAVAHASPRSVRLIVETTATSIRLEIRDDGCGFDLGDVERRRPGLGLISMRERLALVDGRLEVQSTAGKGTTLAAIVPTPPMAAGADGSRR